MDRQHDTRRRNRPAQRNEKPERPSLSTASYAEKFPQVPKPPKRDYEPCSLSGKEIENIFIAVAHRDTGKPVNFDAVVDFLRNSEHIKPEQDLIYVGAGCFGVYEEQEENGLKQKVQINKIVYEDNHHKPDWRRELAPGISRDYMPSPSPLSDLYTQEELRAFPKLGSETGSYMPRTG